MNTKNNCKGCNTTDTCEYIDKANKCPCQQCIVKGMCDVTCDAYLIFANYVVIWSDHTGKEISFKPIAGRYDKRSIFGRK